MAHAPSIVRTYKPHTPEKPTMPRTAKPVDPKALKLELKDAKTVLGAAKKTVTDVMGRIVLDPAGFAKEYRAAVSEHIAAAKAVATLEAKLASAA